MRILLNVAIHLRILDDQYTETMRHEYGSFDAKTGTLISRPNTDEKTLSLREACNKIVHAKLLNFDKEPLPGPGRIEFLHPRLFLYDRRDKRGWRASVDILEFVQAGHALCTAMMM